LKTEGRSIGHAQNVHLENQGVVVDRPVAQKALLKECRKDWPPGRTSRRQVVALHN